jgi:transposase
VLLRLAYLGVANTLAMLRLLPMSDRAKDVEILALRHQITILERQLHGHKIQFNAADRALLAALLHWLPRDVLRQFRLLVRPETVLRWHRDLVAARHARLSRPKRPGRPRTIRSVRTLVLRLARENSSWGYRRIHGELLVLGVKVAASTVWEILHAAGIDPAPDRRSEGWAAFLRSQAQAILAADFFETVTLAGTRMYVLAVIEHATRRGPHPGRHRTPDRSVGDAGCPQSRDGPTGCRLPGPLLDPGPRRQIPNVVRHDPRRHRNRRRAQRRAHAPDELHYGAVDSKLPATNCSTARSSGTNAT